MTVLETKKCCLHCTELFDCGTVNNYLRDYGKIELLKRLNVDKIDCPDFNFMAISGDVLKRKIEHLVEISKQLKSSLKTGFKTVKKNRY